MSEMIRFVMFLISLILFMPVWECRAGETRGKSIQNLRDVDYKIALHQVDTGEHECGVRELKKQKSIWSNLLMRNGPTPELLLVVKTNLALLSVGVANLGAEFIIGGPFSVDIPLVYSPYTIKRDWRWRVLALQPELRYWLKNPLQGHFLGLHAHVGYFNVAWNKRERYQSHGEGSPLWGLGVSYGYVMSVYENWAVEFTLGGGYANIKYDTYYNLPNGAKYDRGSKNYWGITRLGISLVYKFNK